MARNMVKRKDGRVRCVGHDGVCRRRRKGESRISFVWQSLSLCNAPKCARTHGHPLPRWGLRRGSKLDDARLRGVNFAHRTPINTADWHHAHRTHGSGRMSTVRGMSVSQCALLPIGLVDAAFQTTVRFALRFHLRPSFGMPSNCPRVRARQTHRDPTMRRRLCVSVSE